MSASCGVCVFYRWRSLSRADQSSRVDLTECGVSMISKPWRRGRLSSLVLLGYVNKWFYMLIANSLLCHWTGVFPTKHSGRERIRKDSCLLSFIFSLAVPNLIHTQSPNYKFQ